MAGFEVPGGGLDDDAVGLWLDPHDPGSEVQRDTGVLQLVGIGIRDGLVVDDAGLRDPQRVDAGGVGFELRDALGRHPLQAGKAVRAASSLQLVETRDLLPVGRDDELAADLVGDVATVAELDQAAADR